MSIRARSEHLAWLHTRLALAEITSDAVALQNLVAQANEHTSDSPLGTLARVVEACDAILSGDAGARAEQENIETEHLLPGRTPLNSITVAAYVRLRRRIDQKTSKSSEWTGPASETIRRSETLGPYVRMRRLDGQSQKLKPTGSRSRRIEEIIGRIEPVEARQDIRFELESGRRAEKQLEILKKGLSRHNIDLGSITDQPIKKEDMSVPDGNIAIKISEKEAQSLIQLRTILSDNEQLRHFELTYDGGRIKLSRPPSTALISKNILTDVLSVIATLAEKAKA